MLSLETIDDLTNKLVKLLQTSGFKCRYNDKSRTIHFYYKNRSLYVLVRNGNLIIYENHIKIFSDSLLNYKSVVSQVTDYLNK